MNISDDQIPLIIRASEHYAAYLNATQRDDRVFLELADRADEAKTARTPERGTNGQEETRVNE